MGRGPVHFERGLVGIGLLQQEQRWIAAFLAYVESAAAWLLRHADACVPQQPGLEPLDNLCVDAQMRGV